MPKVEYSIECPTCGSDNLLSKKNGLGECADCGFEGEPLDFLCTCEVESRRGQHDLKK